jgi:hypothetical protein
MAKRLTGERQRYALDGLDIYITQIEFSLGKILVGILLVIRSFSVRYSSSFFPC